MTRLSKAHDRWRTRLVMMAALAGEKLHVPSRYMERESLLPAACWGDDGKAWINVVQNAGLRFVGKVLPESYGGHRSFESGDWTGWFTDPDGCYFKDGTGLVWGVVYQLPSRKRTIRCVAGYILGGYDEGPTLDFSRIFTSPGLGHHDKEIKDSDAARQASRHADNMAREIGEEECCLELKRREEEEKEDDDDDLEST